MPDWPVDEDTLLIEHDAEAGAWMVEAGSFGPAGGGTVEIMPRVSLLADIARPWRFRRLEIEADEPTTRLDFKVLNAVSRLAGGDAAEVLERSPTSPTRLDRTRPYRTHPGRTVRFTTGPDPPDPPLHRQKPHRPARPDRATFAAALAGLAASDPDEPVWELEHAHVASVTGWQHVRDDAARDVAALAGRLLDARTDPAGDLELGTIGRRKAQELGQWLVNTLEPIDSNLARSVAEAGLGLFSRTPGAPSPDADTTLRWHRRPGSADIEVELDPGIHRQWICAFDAGLLVAVAPVVETDSGRRAQLYVPPSVTDDHLRIVATDNPADTANTPGLVSFLASTAAGRHAAQLERLGRFSEAASAWVRSAQQWSANADHVRARLARSYADEAHARIRRPERDPFDIDLARSSPIPPPYLADLLHAQQT